MLPAMQENPGMDSQRDVPQASSTSGAPPGATPGPDAPRRARRGPPPNPLYHPLFLPVLLVAFCLWFGWDGFITSDPEMLEHQSFNRWMFGLTALLCLWVVPRGIKEHRDEQAAEALRQTSGNSR